MAKTKHQFTTTDPDGGTKIWNFESDKDSGAVGAGEFEGFYKQENSNQKALIKQDKRIELNIAEFLASQISQKLIPHASAKVGFAKVDREKGSSEDGENIYLVSEFIPGWQGTLYEDVKKTLGEDPNLVKNMAVESVQLLTMLTRSSALTKAFDAANREGNLLNFGEVQVTNLLINNIDTHLANLGTVERGGKKTLATIDYGVAFRNMTSKINPHSITKYLTTHAVRTEAWNNFIFYPENQKINVRFVAELDRVTGVDLSDTYKEAFKTISENYGPVPIEKFALRTGLVELGAVNALKTLYQNSAEYPAGKYKEELVKTIEGRINTSMKKRQQDLSRFSAQIKADLCVGVKDGKLALGSFTDINGKKIEFKDVVLQHNSYFQEVLCGEEKFKFRSAQNKKAGAALVKLAKNEAAYVFSNLIIKDQKICKKYNIGTVDKAFELIKNGTLRGKEFKEVLERSSNLPKSVQERHLDSLIGLAKDGNLSIKNSEIIKNLIKYGSNPDMVMPDGSKIIDHATDFKTRFLLVEKGAKITANVMQQSDIEEQKNLVEVRERYLKKSGKFFFPHMPFNKEAIKRTAALKSLSAAINLGDTNQPNIDLFLKGKLNFKGVKVSFENNPLLALVGINSLGNNQSPVLPLKVQKDIIKKLDASGFDFGMKDKDGNNILHVLIDKHAALKDSKPETAKQIELLMPYVLEQCGKSTEEQAGSKGGGTKVTPLALAVLNNDSKMAEILLNSSGVNAKVNYKNSSLPQIAIDSGNYEMAKLLLNRTKNTTKSLKVNPKLVMQFLKSDDENVKFIGKRILHVHYKGSEEKLVLAIQQNLKEQDKWLMKAVKKNDLSVLQDHNTTLKDFDIATLQKAVSASPKGSSVSGAIKREMGEFLASKGMSEGDIARMTKYSSIFRTNKEKETSGTTRNTSDKPREISR